MLNTPQLIVNGLALPVARGDRYSCYEEDLGTQLEMISGRMVTELRGKVQVISWSFDYLPDEVVRPLLATLRSGGPFPVQYLPDNADQLAAGSFIKTSLTNPTFAFGRGGRAYWHNIAFTLREVAPHD